MADFPTSLDVLTNPVNTDKLNNPPHALQHATANDILEALEAKLGVGASTPTSGKVLRATGTGITSYGQLDVTTDVASFTSSNLRTLLSDETGTGVAVFSGSPTITTPAIAAITNGGTITLPSGTDTLVGKATTDTLTNKTISGTTNLVRSSGANSSLIDSSSLQEDVERRQSEKTFDYIASGCVWTADAAGSTLLATMSPGVVYLAGKRLTVSAVTSRAFTASRDVYVDFSDNGNGTALLTYTDNTLNAASPALAAGSLRNGIVVTGAGSIAASTSINQGQENRVLPIASSIPYAVTDSLGNLICPRDPNRKTLGYRQILSNFATTSTTAVQVTGLTCPVIVPTGRKVKITTKAFGTQQSTNTSGTTLSVWEGVVASGTQLNAAKNDTDFAAYQNSVEVLAVRTPASASQTYNTGYLIASAGTATLAAASTTPAFIMVELL